MKAEHPILELCEAFDVSRSGYYDWSQRRQAPGPRAAQDAVLRERIKSLHQESRETYGSPRIQKDLREEGARHGRNRIARLMREQGLRGRQSRRYRVVTTESNHDQPIAPNRLAEAPAPTAPNQQWVADITYVQTAEGWLYVAAVMDLYSRRIVGWAMSDRIDTALVLMAWNMAILHRHAPKDVLFHSDRGVQYASAEFRQALVQCAARASMSRKACCYDNAAMEAFWSTLKLELIYRREFASRLQARREIFEYIEAFYNSRRRHSSLGYLSPAAFENSLN
jgi:putative transposase